MWLSHPINPSSYKVVKRFDIIITIAKAMKGCHFYYVCAERHAIYGIPDEIHSIREMPLPLELEVPSSFIFRYDTVDADVVNKYIDFAILEDLQWAMVPLSMREEFKYIQPIWRPISDASLWGLVNTRLNEPIDFVDLYGPDGRKSIMLPNVIDLVNGFLRSRQLVSEPIKTYYAMHLNDTIATVLANKVMMGESYVNLEVDKRNYGFFMFKTLFPMNKDDSLDIKLRDRLDNPKIFEIQFIVNHKKNPFKYIYPGQFIESTYATFIHLDS